MVDVAMDVDMGGLLIEEGTDADAGGWSAGALEQETGMLVQERVTGVRLRLLFQSRLMAMRMMARLIASRIMARLMAMRMVTTLTAMRMKTTLMAMGSVARGTSSKMNHSGWVTL
jgi:hypothetical protein